MSTKEDWPRPFNGDAFRAGYDRVFGRRDPNHALTPGVIREYRSDCCNAPVMQRIDRTGHQCTGCGGRCQSTLTRIYQ